MSEEYILNVLCVDDVPAEEIEKQYHFYLSIDYMRSIYTKLEELVPYQMIVEGMFHTFNPKRLVYKIGSLMRDVDEFAKDVLRIRGMMRYDISWFEFLKHSAVHAVEDVGRYFELKCWQIAVIERDINDWAVACLIPNIKNNIEFIEKALSYYGYFLCKKTEQKLNELDYVLLEFKPRFQPIIIDESVKTIQ